ncbi:hypothetical protein PRIPAC_86270, partial [Pristionchus pacificus]
QIMNCLITFAMPMNVHKEDYISRLPEDCAREIFKCLNIHHLDVLKCTSQRLHYLSSVFRNSVQKANAIELEVFKTINGDRFVDLVREAPFLSECFMHESSGASQMIEYDRVKPYDLWMLDYKASNADMSLIIRRAAFLMSRYRCDVVRFTSVLIDDNFVTEFSRVWQGKSMKRLLFDKSSVVSPKGSCVAKRMLNLLLSAKPTVLHLDARAIIKEIDEPFLRSYAQAVTGPQLFARSPTKKPFTVSESFSTILSSFDSLVMDRLQVGADWIMSAILNRLKRRRSGSISCAITSVIYRPEIVDRVESVDSDVEYVSFEGRCVLRLKDTEFYADIKTTEGKPCRLHVNFSIRAKENVTPVRTENPARKALNGNGAVIV